ncbi:putative cysteine desulfurase protein [Phaeoacremonium minimum UCRPA7]|uniref:Putative cysteine desulfurase protein n=1 Tax=Phaeoacremonium minimum (strain UCR-PA7) TaxID=1286976 RepID=R8BEP4_PHAM7|nr:putative cysteine desulfurase protein [Phaeoacremonium minimum UCRPA7]EON97771.1 putative cysteine desulfurase protein [Phaeoacremonium minimum UCRPA7]
MDMTTVRGQFPALSQEEQVYFDNAGGSQTLGKAIDSIHNYLSGTNVQLGATYATGKKSTSLYEKGYEAAAKYINASRDEIVLGASTTQLFRNLSYTLNFNAGDEIVISALDHEANIAPWADLAERQNLTLKWWKSSTKEQPKLLAEDLEALLSDKTRLVTCTHASNILGTIHDVKKIASTAHAKNPNALVCVDAVAYAPHRKIDVKDLGVDFYAFSWYKVYGPHVGMLYASTQAQEQMRSLGHFFNPHKNLENKLGLSASSYELVAAIPTITAYLSDKWTGIVEQEQQLQKTLLDYLNGREDVTVHGETNTDSAVRVPTISFTVKGWKSQDLVEAVEKGSKFGFRWGSFYSYRLVAEFLDLGKDGVVRVSMVHYNTVDEIQAFVAALDKVLSEASQ